MTEPKSDRFSYPYARPSVTADAIVWTLLRGRWQVLLIERKSEPFAGKWALPGGFVNPEEPLVDAAARELREETGVEATEWNPIDGFGGPGRDPRGWTVTMAYYTLISEAVAARAVAGDDARAVRWHPMRKLPPLAFDHADILAAAKRRLKHDLLTAPVAALLCPKNPTPRELAAVYSALGMKHPADGAKLVEELQATGVLKRAPRGKLRFSRMRTG